mgnify:CR=1 FL=1
MSIYILVSLLLATLCFFVYFINKKFSELQKPNDSMALMMQHLADLRRDIENGHGKNRQELQDRLDKITVMMKQQQDITSQTIQKQFSQSAQIISDVTKNLTGLLETNKQVLGFTEQMKSLESILKNPKQRGILGEYFLETLLSNVFSKDQYKMQYKFVSQEIVDAAIFYNGLIVPVDAKFSLEKYNLMIKETDSSRREIVEKEFKLDVKNRIDETAKYIRPSENTTDFAFMFIPAEGVYYSLLAENTGVIEYAFKKHVVIVSPSSFYAYLETVLHGIKAVKMQESVKEIIKNVDLLGKHVSLYDDYMQKLGNNLGKTVSSFNSASREFKSIDKDIFKITDGESGGSVALLEIEKPQESES